MKPGPVLDRLPGSCRPVAVPRARPFCIGLDMDQQSSRGRRRAPLRPTKREQRTMVTHSAGYLRPSAIPQPVRRLGEISLAAASVILTVRRRDGGIVLEPVCRCAIRKGRCGCIFTTAPVVQIHRRYTNISKLVGHYSTGRAVLHLGELAILGVGTFETHPGYESCRSPLPDHFAVPGALQLSAVWCQEAALVGQSAPASPASW